MADGKRNDEMASELFISLPTVKTHVNHIYTKLGVATRVKAVRLYNEQRRHLRVRGRDGTATQPLVRRNIHLGYDSLCDSPR